MVPELVGTLAVQESALLVPVRPVMVDSAVEPARLQMEPVMEARPVATEAAAETKKPQCQLQADRPHPTLTMESLSTESSRWASRNQSRWG